ncbi:hypothetical protein QP028_03305 [Corynebacterium suedekumii]|nr:hypothetical protein QP028_03305 [Corynebacterium suedekumii]
MTSPDLPAPPLRIDDLLGNYVILDPTMQATVGRSGSFPVGTDDRYLHRILFQVWYSGQGWFLGNRGSHITLDVESRSVLPAVGRAWGRGRSSRCRPGPARWRFSTPERTYELHIDIPTSGLQRPQPVQPDEGTEATYERHTPTLEQRQLMDVLAEPLPPSRSCSPASSARASGSPPITRPGRRRNAPLCRPSPTCCPGSRN